MLRSIFLTTGRQGQAVSRETPVVRQHLANPSGRAYMRGERLARVSASPTRSGPEGSSRNEPRLGRCQPLTLFPYFFGARHFVADFLVCLPAARTREVAMAAVLVFS